VYRNFDPAEWHFTIVAPDIEEMRILLSDLSGLDVCFVPVEGMPDDGSSGVWKLFPSVVVQLFKGNYDLVHSHGFTAGMCVAVPAFFRRTPHLMTLHETLNEKQFEGFRGRFRKVGITGLLLLIDKIHSVGNDAQENLFGYFRGLAGKEEKCLVIPNGIEVDRFLTGEPRDLRSELGLGDEIFVIGFLGRFMAPKGFRYLVEAIEILRADAKLPKQPLVLTFGDGGFIREEKEAIKEKNLNRYFEFMPFAPNAAGTIKGLDVVAIPSISEAWPLQPMEAMVCGTPIIGTECIGLREVLRSTPARTVPPRDGSALALAIREEMLNPSKTKALTFKNEAVSRFDVRRQASRLLELYTEIITPKTA
jgi:glycosyltransferase involved in cell wall biosynthesis